MEIVKKNILSILCGVVILLALVALFWPLGGMREDFEKSLAERKATHAKLATLLSKDRTLPVVDLESTDPVPLEQLPGPKVIEAGEQVTKQVSAQAAQMQAVAVEMNRHALLVPRSLPNPTDRQRFDFRDTYRRVIRNVLPTEVLRATMPPTEEDIKAAEDKLWETEFEPRILYKLVKGDDGEEIREPLNQEQIQEDFERAIVNLPEQIRQQRASQFLMYMAEDAILTSEAMEDGSRSPSPAEIWYAQVALWVQDDVCRAIARINSTAKTLVDAPVKQLVVLNVPADETQYVLSTPPMAAMSGSDAEVAPPPDPQGPITLDFTRSPTGRVCNPLYDVVHFTFEVNIDPRMIPPFLQELSRTKVELAPDGSIAGREPCTFITVNRTDLATVDKVAALQEGFAFGDAPVVKLTLECEAIFLRAWTVQYMPPDVKRLLGVEPPADDGTTEQVTLR